MNLTSQQRSDPIDGCIGLPEDKLPQSRLSRFAKDFALLCKRYSIEPNNFAVRVLLASADVKLEAKELKRGKL